MGGGIGAGQLVTAVAVVVSAGCYLLYLGRPGMLKWFDLGVYNHAGLIVRHHPARLYRWQLEPGIKFTYTPFAALIFAVGSKLSLTTLHWLMTLTSVAALALTGGLTFGGLGWRGARRATAAAALFAACLWLEPVVRALQLGQIELLLMLVIVWDLSLPDRRWWKGAGIGIAAGIKMVPLIFIPYLVLCGKFRQALVASGAMAVSVLAGFAVLPGDSAKWWLTGYFLHAGNTGDVSSLVNQSLYAVLARAMGGSTQATPVWLLTDVLVAGVGLSAAAVLHRRGQPVAGWVACAVTGLLVSPVSWDQHWVWLVPVLAVLADRAVRTRGWARAGYWGLTVVTVGTYTAWPSWWYGPHAFRTHYGLIGFFAGPHPYAEMYHLHGFQLVTWNLYAAGGVVMLGLAIATATRAWRSASTPDGTGGALAAPS